MIIFKLAQISSTSLNQASVGQTFKMGFFGNMVEVMFLHRYQSKQNAKCILGDSTSIKHSMNIVIVPCIVLGRASRYGRAYQPLSGGYVIIKGAYEVVLHGFCTRSRIKKVMIASRGKLA